MAASADALPPYLDPAHQWYSEDLDAAVKAWSALYVDGGFKAKDRGHIKQIMDWLRQHYPGWTDFARKGVAKTVNPNKIGGNPTTKKN